MISIIIPVYNVGEYLPKCLESILAQTYRQFEVILVDDGSLDDSGSICDRFASQDMRISVIHKTNGGVSSARNAGLRVAKGEYVSFIDSDDFVGNNYLQRLVDEMECCNVDMVAGGEIKVENGSEQPFSFRRAILTQKDFSDLFSKYDFQKRCSPWGKLFKTQIIRDAKLEFNENIHLGEDIIFMFYYINLCSSICLTPSSEYYYLQRLGSLTKRLNQFDSEAQGYFEYTKVKNRLIEHFDIKELSCRKLNQWSIIFLDRVKMSILDRLTKEQQLLALSKFDWRALKEYKTYRSRKEYFWDSLLWHKRHNLFLLVHKVYKKL